MVFTIEEFHNFVVQNVKANSTKDRANTASINDKKRREKEAVIVSKVKPCVIESNIYSNLDHIRDNNLTSLYNDQFYSEGFMRYLAEISCPIFYPMASNSTIVKEWFKDFKKVGAESAEGVAIMASMSDHDKLFIIKGPRSKSSDLAHEAVVGLALNPLRAMIPNFSWVFGVLRCSLPITDNDKVLSWCDANDPVTYVVYERVPGISLRDFLKTAAPEQFLDVYLQVLESLHMASKFCQFTHYDLHYDNIIIRPLDNEATIAYEIDGNVFYHRTKNVATFIDYGFAHAVYKGEHFGRYDFQGYSVMPDRAYTMFDAFKLLGFCMSASPKQLMPLLTNIMKFFTRERASDIITSLGVESGIFYSLPYQLGSKLKLKTLIDYLIVNTKPQNITLSPTNNRILSCNLSGTCLDSDAIVRYTGIDHKGELTSITGYKIALTHGQVSPEVRTRFKELFVNRLYTEEYAHLKKEIEALADLIAETKPIVAFSNPHIAERNLRDSKVRKLYKNYVNKVVDMVAKYNHILEGFDTLILIMRDLGFEPERVQQYQISVTNAYSGRLNRLITNVMGDINSIKSLPGNYSPELSWFYQVLPNYVDALRI
jgi:serine/threonine protein kinase